MLKEPQTPPAVKEPDPSALVVTLTISQFDERVQRTVAAEIEKIADAEVQRVLHARQEVCIAIGCSGPTFAALVAEGCPYVLVGEMKKFVLADVLAWLKARTAERAAAGAP